MSHKKLGATRPIEMYRLNEDRTWDTVEVEILANTDPNCIEEIARIEAARVFGPGSYMLYNSMDDQCPEIPRMHECDVRLIFQLDQTTVGSEIEQTAAAIDQINLTLQREPYGLGARLEKIV